MDSPSAVSFPLPMLTALLFGVLAVFVWRLELGIARASAAFSALFALCMIQALLVGLRFGYGITGVIPVQRTLPLLLGPLMYLSFAAMAYETRDFARLAVLHIAGPLVAAVAFVTLAGDARNLDWLLSASYVFYLAALYRLWRKGPDALIFARVDMTGTLSNWILRSIGLLLFILALDTVIALDFMLNQGTNAPTLIFYGTVPLVLALTAFLITIPTLMTRSRPPTPPVPAAGDDDARTEARLRELMAEERIFLDPNLTVQRLARRLHLPAREVSGAINRTQGMNVSQYVNDFRLSHAAALLATSDDSVASIAEQSGFMTRSNFYREFQRVHGRSPTEYRADAKSADHVPG